MPESRLRGLLASSFRPPDGTTWNEGDDVSQYYHNWGFTIYRTCYESGSDSSWEALLSTIEDQVRESIESFARAEQHFEPDVDKLATQLIALYRLDAQSHPDVLKSKSIHEVRGVYRQQAASEEAGQRPLHHDGPGEQLFLLADNQVLQSFGKGNYSLVKCVAAQFDGTDISSRNNANEQETWYGWMRMTTQSVVELCMDLPYDDLETLGQGQSEGDEKSVYQGELTGCPLP